MIPSHFQRRSRNWRRCVFSALTVLLFWLSAPIAPPALAVTLPEGDPPTGQSTPLLSLITPRGVQRGHEHKLRFTGQRLKGTEEVFLHDPSSGITVTGITQVDDKKVDVTINVPAECRLGEQVAQLRTRGGISDYRSFFVGALPDVPETEPNNDLETAGPIEWNVTLSGICTNEDIDYFRLSGKKGQRLSVEVEAIRLGAMFDAAIVLLNADRFEIATSDDTPLTNQDPWFSVLLPADGDYFVAIREASFRGNNACRYRMHVGDFPRPMAVFPAGGKRGEKLTVQFIDRIANEDGSPRIIEQEITVPESKGFRPGIFYSDDQGITPSPLPFQISEFGSLAETEPNNNFNQTVVTDVPIAINGIISKPGDMDYFKFRAKKSQVLEISCYARRIGSGLDPIVNVFGADKKHIVGNDDATLLDSYLRFQAPADGEYFVRVRDHLKTGQPSFVYRLEIVPAKPQLTFKIQRNDRYSQLRQSIAIGQGNRFAVLLDATRKEFGGELKLLADNLPPGITMSAPPMHNNLNTMPVVFEATADAAIKGELIDLRGGHVDDAKNITGQFFNLADFALGEPNKTLYYGCRTEQLPIAVIEPLPFKIEIIQPKVPLLQNGSMKLKVVAHRNEGFDEPIQLNFPFRSPGVGTTNQITIPKGKSEVVYPLNANGKAQIGNWPMYVIGKSNVRGPAWAASQMAELEIAELFVKFEFERASVGRGESTTIVCKIEQLMPFEGEARVKILGVPPDTTVSSDLAFNAETKELSFDLQATEKSPFGKHKPFAQVTITKNGEPMVSRAGTMEFHINKQPKLEIQKQAASR
jgi:hypothetical protein